MSWKFTISSSVAPKNIQILVNDKVVFDECKGSMVDRLEAGKTVAIVPNFLRVNKVVPFKLTIKQTKSNVCYTSVEDYYLRADQEYVIGRDSHGFDIAIVNVNK